MTPQFSGCGPLASHTIPTACLSSTGFRQIRPTRPVGGEWVPSSASRNLCCQLPQTRLPHMTHGSLQSFAYFHQPRTPKESHSWRIRSSLWVTVQPLSLRAGRQRAGSEITHLSRVCCVRLGHWHACNPRGDQASLQLGGWGHPSNGPKPRRWCLPCSRGGRRGGQDRLSTGEVLYHLTLQQGQLFLLPWRRHLLGAGRHLCHPGWHASCCPEKMKKMKAQRKCSLGVS